jgi:hypothetical protein
VIAYAAHLLGLQPPQRCRLQRPISARWPAPSIRTTSGFRTRVSGTNWE